MNTDDVSVSKLVRKYAPQNAAKLMAAPLDRVELSKKPLPYERLDQLTMELLMGVR